MRTPIKLTTFTKHEDHFNQIRKIQGVSPSTLIGLWSLNELSGTTAYDQSGAKHNFTYINSPALGQTGIGDGGTAPLFTEASVQYATIDPTGVGGLASSFSALEGSLLIWSKVTAAGDWTAGANKRIALFGVDANNFVRVFRSSASAVGLAYNAGGTTKTQTAASESSTAWISWLLTWSKSNDRVLGYRNGVSLGAAATGLGTWVGTLANGRCLIGADAGPAAPWNGYLAFCALWSSELTAANAVTLAAVP